MKMKPRRPRWLVWAAVIAWAGVCAPLVAQEPVRFVRFDLVTANPKQAISFYKAVFGWKSARQSDGWTLLSSPIGNPLGGVFQNDPDDPEERDALWVGLLGVDDVGDMTKRFESLGAKTLFGPNRIADGRLVAVLEDPERAVVGLTDDPGFSRKGVHFGEWVWVELWSKDARAAVETYRELAGFEVTEHENQAGGITHILRSGGEARGGIVDIPIEGIDSHWLPYVLVEDLDRVVEQAEKRGGQVVGEPADTSYGRSVIVIDPTGAGIGALELDGEKETGP